MADKQENGKDGQIYIGARVPIRISDILKKVCEQRGEDAANFIRRTIYTELAQLGYLSESECKALGISKIIPTQKRK